MQALIVRFARRCIVGLVGAATLAACSADLTETSTNFVSPDQFYKTDGQVQIAINGVYAPLMDWNGWKQPAQHSIMCDDDQMNCESWMGGGFGGQIQGQWYADGNSVWFGDYQIIERANEVIEYVGNSAGVGEAAKKRGVGMAKFARAYAYFDLVRRFGAVPIRTELYRPDAAMGALARSPIEEVYHQITKDLLDAAADIPKDFDGSTGQGLPRAASAWGLLSKVYLHMAGAEVAGTPLAAAKNAYLDSAIIAAQNVADGTAELEPAYMDLFNVDKQGSSHEILFAIQGSRSNGSNVVPFFSPAGDCTLTGGCGPAGPGFVTMRRDFVKSFDAADKRMEPGKAYPMAWLGEPASQSSYHGEEHRIIHRDSLAKLFAAGLIVDTVSLNDGGWIDGCVTVRLYPGYYTVKYKTTPTSTETTTETIGLPYTYYTLKYTDRGNSGSEYGNKNNFIILRYADVLLTLAEAENERNGPTSVAMTAINQVRQRAGLSALPALGQAEFRDAVRAERAHELYGEFQRTFDLRRYGTYLEVMNAPATTEFYTNVVCRPRQAYQLLQPIPTGELAANPLIQQNPGY